MFLKNGVWTKGPPPKVPSKGPRVVTHRSQRSLVVSSGRRLDSLLNGGPARICIKRSLGGLGDILMSTPIARGAKKKFPNSYITYAVPTGYAGGDLVALLQHIPYIDEVLDFSLVNRDDYDSFTDITRIGLSDEKPYTIPLNRIDLFANASGIPLFNNFRPIYIMTEEERAWGKEFVKQAVGGKQYRGLISIHMGSRDPKRCWPKDRIREFINLARKEGFFCFLYEWGAPADEWKLSGTCQVFDYGIRNAAAVMMATDVLVCPDSMMLHLAGALNFKTVSLFGSMPPACRINHYPNALAVVNQQISCLGCLYAKCENNYYCMSSILPEAVLVAVKHKISSEYVDSPDTIDESMIQPGVLINKTINTFAI